MRAAELDLLQVARQHRLVRHHGLPLWFLDKDDPERAVTAASLVTDTRLLALLERNRRREDGVPDAGVRNLLGKQEVPDATEAHRVQITGQPGSRSNRRTLARDGRPRRRPRSSGVRFGSTGSRRPSFAVRAPTPPVPNDGRNDTTRHRLSTA